MPYRLLLAGGEARGLHFYISLFLVWCSFLCTYFFVLRVDAFDMSHQKEQPDSTQYQQQPAANEDFDETRESPAAHPSAESHQQETLLNEQDTMDDDATDAELGLLKALDDLNKQNSALKKEVETQQAALQEKEDQLLRALAEMQNVQKRMHDQVAKARDFAVEGFAKDLLTVVDSLEKAACTNNQENEQTPAMTQHIAGVQMTLDLLFETLRKHQIEQVQANIGQAFNHELHLAMTTVERDDMQPNSIVEIFQPGYMLQSRLLRAAMVSVSKKPT